MNELCAVILAAGQGTRMRSKLPKVAHQVAGLPMITYVLEACRALRAKRTLVVVGYEAERVREALGGEAIEFVLQQEQRGTGHALLLTGHALSGFDGDLLVLSGDTPLLTSTTLEGLIEAHRRARAEATILTAEVPQPTGYGRVVRDERGELLRIVEELEATPQEREIHDINAAVYCFAAGPLMKALRALRPSAVKGELYLPDVVALLRERGGRVQAYRAADPEEVLGVNTRAELAEVHRLLWRKTAARLLAEGITLLDPESAYVGPLVSVGQDSILYPGVTLEGRTAIGEGTTIHSGCRIRDAKIGNGTVILDGCLIQESEIGDGCQVGPYAHLVNVKKELGVPLVEQQLSAHVLHLGLDDKVRKLIERGARILKPDTVTIGPEVRLENIEPKGLVIYQGTKIIGEKTLILEGAELGHEEPVTLENAVLGKNISIKGGYIKDSVLLDGCEVRQGFHAREGCLLEERVYCAHNVGIKMTIAFPFVVLGSLINFCDCLIAGGTSRRNHTEIGSAFIHFNYGPRGDKATPSLFGDVPKGVMLNQPPIFLGGLCGVVGPSRLGFGSVLSAGRVYRSDYEGGLLVMGEDFPTGSKSYNPLRLASIRRKIFNNMLYIANLTALWSWYKHVRTSFAMTNPLRVRLINGALETLEANIKERVQQLDRFRDLVAESIRQTKMPNNCGVDPGKITEQQEFVSNWDDAKQTIEEFKTIQGDVELRERFCQRILQSLSDGTTEYLSAIQSVNASHGEVGTLWLNSIVNGFISRVREAMPQNLREMAGESSSES